MPLKAGIVHLGLGAFARAHLLPATDDALAATGDERFGVVGISLVSPATREALKARSCRYTLRLRDGSGESVREIRSLLDVLHAPSQPQSVLDHLAGADTRIVSLTVTEKGYLDSGPGSTLDWLLRGLAARRQRQLGGVTVMSLDNLAGNGRVLRERLLLGARQHDAALAGWIASHCSFPCSMVDRIVPRSADPADIAAEPFFDWALEDRFVAGRPAWEHGGATLVDDAAPYEARKLRMVNGAHSALAYLGIAAGFATVDQAIADAALRGYIVALLRDEIEPTLSSHFSAAELAQYRDRVLQRFTNPCLGHRLLQIAMDGSQKIPQRWLPVLRERLARDESVTLLAVGLAAWGRYLGGSSDGGVAHTIDDPAAVGLQAVGRALRLGSDGSTAARLLLDRGAAWAGLVDAPLLCRSLAHILGVWRQGGVGAVLRSAVTS